MSEFRFDTTTISTLKRTPQGGLDVPASLTRSGIFIYHMPDGTVQREYRPPEEVFNEDSLATLGGASVTIGHSGLVTSDNWGTHTVGHVGDSVRGSGQFVDSRLRIQRADAVKKVEARELVELSCGYTCDLERVPGEVDGEHYDAIQRNIRYNHVALLPPGGGRAGSDVKLRLDSMESRAGYTSLMDLAEAQKEIERLNGLLAGEKTRADALDKQMKEIDVDALVADRLALVQDAQAVLGTEVKLDGKDDQTIMREACQKAFPEVKLDEKSSPDYVRGLFEAASRQAKAGAEHVRKGNVHADAASVEDKVAGARARNDERSRNAWKGGK